jgi:hypothetical protein
VKVDNGDKKAEVENKVEGAKLVKVDKKRKADKKSKSEAGKKATSIPTVASPAGESCRYRALHLLQYPQEVD